MSLSRPFIERPVGTTLLTLAISLAGAIAYFVLPVSPLPQVDFPTIQVNAVLPGASPETMAATVATPLERQFTRIAGINEMSSSSSLGSCTVTMQFDLSRTADSAGRDVQAAINAARSQLPANLPTLPSWKKSNPSDTPVVVIAMTAEHYTKPQMYRAALSILQPRLSQIAGVGQVTISGGSPPAIRVSVNPTILNHLGLSLDEVRAALGSANANLPKGQLMGPELTWSIAATDQLFRVEDYRQLILKYQNGAPLRLGDVATVTASVDNIRSIGLLNGEPALSVEVFRQPNANIIATCDRVRELLPELQAQIPAGMSLTVVVDRTTMIRSSVQDVQWTLLLSIALVVGVVYLFLGDVRSTLIPSITVPVSLLGTFGVMLLCEFSINNLSLMAMTIATGFVVDDAIVVMENINRYLQAGDSPRVAAVKGAREIGFTVLSITISLVAVFIPVLLMQGIVGRLLREFAMTLSIAIGISMLVALTTTPMMCSLLLQPGGIEAGSSGRWSTRAFDAVQHAYAVTLGWVLRRQRLTLAVAVGLAVLSGWLYVVVPKGFFPKQDNGRIFGGIQADQQTSFQNMSRILERTMTLIAADPAVLYVLGSASGGGGPTNTARMQITLKPFQERQVDAETVIGRIRAQTSQLPGATVGLQAAQDLRVGGRPSPAQYQYTLSADSLDELDIWAPRFADGLRTIAGLVDVNVDQQSRGRETRLEIDRVAAARLGIDVSTIDNNLYDAFGQRQVSRIYRGFEQTNVILDVPPEFSQSPDSLRSLFLTTPTGGMVPLHSLLDQRSEKVALVVNHTGQFPSVTLSFNLTPGTSLGDVVPSILRLKDSLGMPSSIQGRFEGTAQVFQASLRNQPVLILAALISVYLVLGMLYESLIHPLTILSTLPSAGVGALLALLVFRVPLDVVGMIGILLLIGIVKKNAIMMIDFALSAERQQGLTPEAAISAAAVQRFRPIVMTTCAALLGGLPLALGTGIGAELRKPLGISIVGGLLFSQLITLYTTPVVYVFLDRWRTRLRRRSRPRRVV